ncbi:MAG: heme ABC transporter ATP-binding protein [Paracoccaceae bacterium]
MKATNISVSLNRKPILHGVSMEAQPGQVTAIVGPNGSGKSTFLRAVTGEVPYSGDVSLNARPIAGYKPWELAACRGVLQQAVSVSFPFTVREIVQLGHSAGLNAADPTVPEAALRMVDLDGFAHRFYQDLSGGEQQRTQLARALAQVWQDGAMTQPRWLFLDEPISSLDIGHQYIVMDIARDFAARGGGVVTVLHDLNLTAMFADHVVLMQKGRVFASGPCNDVLASDTLSDAYDCPVAVNAVPPRGVPFILPQSRLETGRQ